MVIFFCYCIKIVHPLDPNPSYSSIGEYTIHRQSSDITPPSGLLPSVVYEQHSLANLNTHVCVIVVINIHTFYY